VAASASEPTLLVLLASRMSSSNGRADINRPETFVI
jgi:hypothetical protein